MPLSYFAIILFDLALIWALAYILAPAARLLRGKLRDLQQMLWRQPRRFVGGFTVEDDYPPRPPGQ